MKFIIGILVMVVGALLVIKTEWFIENFGRSEWAEQKLGNGGTHLFYKLLAVTGIILALLGMTGALGEIIIGIFGSLFGLRN